jgi:AcrR family transcriptional regulator
MTPPPAAPKSSLRERQRARARDDILDAVVQVFAEEDGSGALIELVAAAAGLSRATLYAHFPGGIDEMIKAAYERAGEQFIAQTRSRLRDLTDWRARIRSHAEVMAEWGADAHRGVFYNIVGPKLLASVDRTGLGSTTTQHLVEAELERARQLGDIPQTVDPVSVAAMLTACVGVVGVEAARESNHADRYVFAFNALLHGLESDRGRHAGNDERPE